MTLCFLRFVYLAIFFTFQAPKIYCDNMQDFWEGQGLDIYFRENYFCPTEDEHKKMAEKSK